MEKFEEAFDSYLEHFDKDIKQIRYKYKHSYCVESLMEELAKRLGLPDSDIYLSKVIGLLHDIGRFEQITLYNSCSDLKTGYNHGDEGCKFLFDNNHIRDFIEDDSNDEIIKDAIKYHNKFEIDDSVKDKNLFFTKMIRDMDKVDVFRVLSEEYTFIFDGNISSKVENDFINRQSINSIDKKTESDKVVQLLAFIFDFNFKESFEILEETGFLNKMYNTITVKEEGKEKFNKMKEIINNYLEGVKNVR